MVWIRQCVLYHALFHLLLVLDPKVPSVSSMEGCVVEKLFSPRGGHLLDVWIPGRVII